MLLDLLSGFAAMPSFDPTSSAPAAHRRRRGFAVDGALLRRLRKQHQLTQEQLAHHCRLTARLVSKAEAGGPIDACSLRALVQFLRPPDSSLTLEDVIRDHEGLGETISATQLAEQFVLGMWRDDWQTMLERIAHDSIVLYCEQGRVSGRGKVETRIAHVRDTFPAARMNILELAGEANHAVARWLLVPSIEDGFADMQRRRGGVTWIAMEDNRIREAWEFWTPDPQAPVLPVLPRPLEHESAS